MQISQDLDHRSIVFIRFNPDDYINSKGIKMKSSWVLNKKGLLVIPDENKNNWNIRLQSLNNQIKYWINPDNKTDKMLEIIELYYDKEVVI